MSHAKIEAVEDAREAEFTGIPIDGQDAPSDPLLVLQGSATEASSSEPSSDEIARRERAEYAKAQAKKFSRASVEAASRDAWGNENGGFARPRDMADRLRANVPRKFKMKSSWFGDF